MNTSTHRVAAAVAAVLALTLAACSGNTDTPAAAGSSTATTSTMTTSQAPTGPSSTTPGQGSATGASGQYGPGMMGGGTLADSTVAGMMTFVLTSFASGTRRSSGTGTTPTLGSIVANG